jgi:hypothetical protein
VILFSVVSIVRLALSLAADVMHRYKYQGFKQNLELVANILLDQKRKRHLNFPDSDFFISTFSV